MSDPGIKQINRTIPDHPMLAPHDSFYAERWTWLWNKGIEMYGENFHLTHEDAEVILKLITWFACDPGIAGKVGVDTGKGIMLAGPVGCGKTSLMNICRFFLPPERRHIIKACRDISLEFISGGHKALNSYTRESFRKSNFEPKIYCFDDLGFEYPVSANNNQFPVMGEILLSRYDLFHSFGMLTHVTTNLNIDEIKARYGSHVSSRCNEMFNIISFDNNSIDKRK